MFGYKYFLAVLRELSNQLYLDRFVFALIGIHFLSGLVATVHIGTGFFSFHQPYLHDWLIINLLILPCSLVALAWLTLARRSDRRRNLGFRQVFAAKHVAYVLSGHCLLAGLLLFRGTFNALKSVLWIPYGGFRFDHAQANLDRFIHFGIDPWRPLHALAGYDWTRILLERNYGVVWALLCFGAVSFIAVLPQAASIRRRYFCCYLLTWIVVGNLFAGLFISAGPAFYGNVTGDTERFADLLGFLARSGEQPFSAAAFQTYLWELYLSGEPAMGSGISAFPSMHVALITVNVLFLFEWRRWVGCLGVAYALLIALSSVYLGWHYAIDVYAAVGLSCAIFWMMRWKFATERGRHSAQPDVIPSGVPVWEFKPHVNKAGSPDR